MKVANLMALVALVVGIGALLVHFARLPGHPMVDVTGAVIKGSELPSVKGLGSILEGWTFTNNWGEDDRRVDTILQAHGAKEAESGVVSDIQLNTTSKDGELVLWVRYRGQDRFVRKSDPEFFTQVTKILIDLGHVRLGELRQEISRKEGK